MNCTINILVILVIAVCIIGCTECNDVVLEQKEPCDIGSSLIQNAGFEELTILGDEPSGFSQLNKAKYWFQATDATSDFYNIGTFDGSSANLLTTSPPNGSSHYAGAIFASQLNYYEYIGGCLINPIIADSAHSISLLVGTNKPGGNWSNGTIDGELVVLGIPNCNFPISGVDCKEDDFEVLISIPLEINAPDWEMVTGTFTASVDFPAIMIGLSCTVATKEEEYYLLVDDIIINEGEPCEDPKGLSSYVR